jgi:hypothetical protein
MEAIGSFTVMQDTVAPLTTASPAGGTYSLPLDVTLLCRDIAGGGCAASYYTTDGSDPTESSLRYTGPITITGPTTLKFRSIDVAGNLESVVKSEVYTLTASALLVTASPLRVQVTGYPVTFTATGQGGTGSYEYEFWKRKSDVATWTKEQDYSASNSWTWDTNGNATGPYYVKVQVRCAGSTAASEAVITSMYSLVETPPATGVALTTNPTSPQQVGTQVIFMAAASGGSENYEYKFLLRSSGTTTWASVQDYLPVNNWTWDTSAYPAGTYYVMVYARNAGSPAIYEVVRSMAYTIASLAPATAVSLSAEKPSPAHRRAI